MKKIVQIAGFGIFASAFMSACSDTGQTTSSSSGSGGSSESSTSSSSSSSGSSSSSSNGSSSSGSGQGGVGGMGGDAGSGQAGMGGLGGMGGMGQGGLGGIGGFAGMGGGGGVGAMGGNGGSGGMGGMGGSAFCGNGVLNAGEACDDSNLLPGDGCNAVCQIEAVCGNGTKESGEACDDGNMTAGDGCLAGCMLESGTLCGNAINLQNPMLVTKDGEVTVYNGSNVGSNLTNYSNPSCSAGTTNIPTVLHRYRTQPTLTRLIAHTMPIAGPLFDPVLWMHADCLNPGTEMACDDDSGSGKHPKLRSPVISPSTEVTFVLAGHNATDVGPYQLVLTEQPLVALPNAGTCAAPQAVGPGHYLVTTGGVGTLAGTCTGTGAPEGVLSLALNQASDVRLTVTPEASTLDVGVYVRVFPCGNGNELGCAEAGASGQPELLSLRDMPAGNYALVVDGFTSQDAGLVQVDIDVKPIVALGMPCDPLRRNNRCVSTASCVGLAGTAVCKAHTVLFEENFDMDLGMMSVVDIFSDGNGWGYCDPVLGCTQDNTTESLSGGGFALIKDKANAMLDGEQLRTPAVTTTGFGTVLVAFDHDFDHWDLASDVARVEGSKDGVTWTALTSYTLDATGSVLLNASAVCANSSCRARFVYDDQTAGGDSFAEEWRIDDVRILAIP